MNGVGLGFSSLTCRAAATANWGFVGGVICGVELEYALVGARDGRVLVSCLGDLELVVLDGEGGRKKEERAIRGRKLRSDDLRFEGFLGERCLSFWASLSEEI